MAARRFSPVRRAALAVLFAGCATHGGASRSAPDALSSEPPDAGAGADLARVTSDGPSASRDAPPPQSCDMPAVPAAARAARVATLKQDLVKLAAAAFTPVTSGFDLRDNTQRAQIILASDGDPAPAEALVTQTLALLSPDGLLPGVTDLNAIQFTMAPVGPILLRYADKLSAAFKAAAPGAVAPGIIGVRNYKPVVQYTNIWLMRAVNLLLLGEAVGDASAEADGLAALQEWLDYAKGQRAGISEYDSPTYTAVQMHVVQTGFNHTTDPRAKALLKRILDFYWNDVAANHFAGRGSLSGPHSRDYSLLLPTAVQPDAYVEGLTARVRGDEEALAFVEGTYAAPACALRWQGSAPRVVRQLFGTGMASARFDHPGMDRYNYVTTNFAIGSTGALAGTGQERLVSVELASPRNVPVIAVNFAADPYIKGTSGFAVNPKEGAFFTSVQDRGDVLAIFDSKGMAAGANVVLPADVDATYVDGKPAALVGQTLTATSVVALREGATGVVIRIFAFGTEPPRVEAGQSGANRLFIPGSRGAFVIRAANVDEAGLLALVADTSDPRARLASEDIAGGWRATAQFGPLSLSAALGPQATLRQVNGVDVTSNAILSVDGVDLSDLLP